MKVSNYVYDRPALLVEVTRKCNNHCNYCASWRNYNVADEKVLSVDMYKKLFQSVGSIAFSRITFTGGEPTIRKDLYDIIYWANIYNPDKEIHIHTNGSLILKNERIWSLPIKAVKININTVSKTIYKDITGNDNLHMILAGIDYLKERGLPLRLHAVASQVSYPSIFELIDYCINNQIDLKIFEIDTSLSSKDKRHVDMSKIISCLEKKSVSKLEYATPGLPVISYTCIGGTEIQVVLASTPQYSNYLCKDCEYFPCSYGLYTVSVSPEGYCYPCLINEKIGRVKLDFNDLNSMNDNMNRIFTLVKDKQ